VPAFVKPKESRQFLYSGATMIVCNAKEAHFFISQKLEDDDAVERGGKALLAHFGCASAVITRGREGLNVFEKNEPKSFHVSATSSELSYERVGKAGIDQTAHGRQVFDVTGAGDTVLSVLALTIAGRIAIREAALLANAGAGVVVGKLGTSTITPEELFAAVRELR
jgi:D-beta-D-heptose 7-phosphate kinase/D-beta-D-heptose 1-phosphate adenosyltransferase